MKARNDLKRILILYTLFIIQGCAYSAYTTKLDSPIDRPNVVITYKSVFDVKPEGVQQASIGGELFRISRFMIGRQENIVVRSPIRRFPKNAEWYGTYLFNDGIHKNLIVYTSPSFYREEIGVILDSKYHLATIAPLVQVVGAKKGRRWEMRDEGKFFALSNELIERWGIRYGGRSDGYYIFELFNKNEANVIEILQSIKISEQDFLGGITVRDVFIQGLEKDNQGIIKYTVKDLFNMKQ